MSNAHAILEALKPFGEFELVGTEENNLQVRVKGKPIWIHRYLNDVEYIFGIGLVLPYADDDDCKDIPKPNRMNKPTQKAVNAWIEYCDKCIQRRIEVNKERNEKIEKHIAIIRGLLQGMYSGWIDEKEKRAHICKGDVNYDCSWNGGYISQKITVYDNSLQCFIGMTKEMKLIKYEQHTLEATSNNKRSK